MPRANRTHSFDELLEDLIAELLSGRDALIELDAFILANRQYGNLSGDDAQMLLDATDKARRGLQNGLRFGRLLRSPPPDLEALAELLEEWERARGRPPK